MSNFTEEQRCRMEENRRKALEKLANRNKSSFKSCQTEVKVSPNVQGVKQDSSSSTFFNVPKSNPKEKSNLVTRTTVANLFFNGCSSKYQSENSLNSNKTSNFYGSANANAEVAKVKFHSPVTEKSQEKLVRAVCVLLTTKRFFVDVCYHQQMIEIFKSIPSRAYDAKDRKWNFGIEDHDKLIGLLKQLPKNVIVMTLPKNVVKVFCQTSQSQSTTEVDLSSLDSVLLTSLLPFQKEGVIFGIHRGGNVLIADDMGLGKTIQAIAIADYYKSDWPLLVVTPSSVRYAWAEAFRTWLPSLDQQEVTIINSGKDYIPNDKVILMSYDLLTKKTDELLKRKFKTIILDESHALKNHKSARTKAAQVIMKYAKHIVMLSGTPALSRPIELYTQISALKPKYFGSFMDFGVRYCDGKQMQWGWDFSGSSNMKELQLLLEETVMIRRLKSEVVKQLPPKSRQMVVLNPNQVLSKSKILVAMANKMMKISLKGMERRGVLLEYFHETGIVKLPAICEYIKDLLEADHKFICFAHHRTVLDGISDTIEKLKLGYIRIDGSTTSENRKVFCDKFQYDDKCRVAVLSITAANSGITLTATQLVVFAELFWNPGILTQAEDRAHRIGQEDSVVVQYLVARGTADDYIWPLVQRKLDTLNKAGLSKDNFSDADTLNARDPTQPSLEEFFDDCELDTLSQLWEEETACMGHSHAPAKRLKSK